MGPVQEPHTTHNQSRKWHRNGIKKPRAQVTVERVNWLHMYTDTHPKN
ncbi:hypothetical protein [Streptococcus anginosus]